ncbi:rhoptry kinase family protein ROP27 [Toxoplasma gondii MAS]|uniref:Rhoptry kinase family protein ROP27 n=1 Tax=Toxoplasma gondii MAS TaxID=943118 RepID=A0A086QYW6_TOXGO|nr:rhoptry kinase family protein ROP27 [Toxoplasma gondii MAS]
MKSQVLPGGGVGALPVFPVKPLGLVVLCFLLLLLVSEVLFLWRLQQLENDASRPSLDSLSPSTETSTKPPPSSPLEADLSASLVDAKDLLRLLSNISTVTREKTIVSENSTRVADDPGAVHSDLDTHIVSSVSSLTARPSVSDTPRLRSLQSPKAPVPPPAPSHSEASSISPSSSLTGKEEEMSLHHTPSTPPRPSSSSPASGHRSPDSPHSPAGTTSLVSASGEVQASAVHAISTADPLEANTRTQPEERGSEKKRTSANEKRGRRDREAVSVAPAAVEDEEEVEEVEAFHDPFSEDDVALLRVPDLLVSQNATAFRMQFLSEDERRRVAKQKPLAVQGAPSRAKKKRAPDTSASASFSPPASHAYGSLRWKDVSFPASATVTHIPGHTGSFAEVYEPFLKGEDPRLLPHYLLGGSLGLTGAYGAFAAEGAYPRFSAGSTERRLKTDLASPDGAATLGHHSPARVSRHRSAERSRSSLRAGQRAAGVDGNSVDPQQQEAKGEEAARRELQRDADHVEDAKGKEAENEARPTARITRSVVGNALLTREVRESSENLANLVNALDSGGSPAGEHRGALQTEDKEGGSNVPEATTPRLRLADLPKVLFSKPSRSLVKAARALERSVSSKEKQKLAGIIPFDVPVVVRSLATQKRRTVIFDGVLGAGGQGVVLLARDVDHPGLEMAVKIFRIKKKNRGASALHEIARLQRRLRWETAILKYAPRDVSSYVWSQLAHLVMPLDIVEPVEKWEHSDAEMRYWHQWLIFESFAGDVTRLKKLHSGSGQARLDASKQIFMACMRLHDTGMVHSDIKLANYFISSEGRIFLGDYSLSRPIGDVSPCVEGTLRFLPPENMKCIRDGEKNLVLSSKKDTWAVGVALYKLWCRNFFPFDLDSLSSEHAVDRVAEVSRDELNFYPCAPDMPVAVMDLIQQMLDPNIETRPTLRDLFVSHPVFSQLRKVTLQYTLADFREEQANQKGI